MIFHGLGFLTDLINWVIASPTKGIALLAIANPLTMTIVAGLVFEGRMVRLWHGQSRSFFPGDLFLWLAASTAIVASSRIGVADLPEAFTSFWSKNGAIIAFVFASVLLWLMRKVYDAPAYARTPGATADSVTKWAHDIFGYWWYSLFLITTGLPMLVAAFTSLDKTFAVMSAVFVLSIAIWGGDWMLCGTMDMSTIRRRPRIQTTPIVGIESCSLSGRMPTVNLARDKV